MPYLEFHLGRIWVEVRAQKPCAPRSQVQRVRIPPYMDTGPTSLRRARTDRLGDPVIERVARQQQCVSDSGLNFKIPFVSYSTPSLSQPVRKEFWHARNTL